MDDVGYVFGNYRNFRAGDRIFWTKTISMDTGPRTHNYRTHLIAEIAEEIKVFSQKLTHRQPSCVKTTRERRNQRKTTGWWVARCDASVDGDILWVKFV